MNRTSIYNRDFVFGEMCGINRNHFSTMCRLANNTIGSFTIHNLFRMTMTPEAKKVYNKEYRKHRVHRVIIFSKEEYEHLTTLAEKHRKPFSTLVRELDRKSVV